MAVTPYVVGQWVRDERFYGRGALLEEILDGNRNCLWILGTRRVGKTSVLKQLEHLTSNSPEPRYFPLFWDFQGAEEAADLHEGFRDSLLDACDRLESLGIDLEAVDDEDLFVSLAKLRRQLRPLDLKLLLLGDEAEELLNVRESSPRFLRRLRRALQSPENIRTVLASTIGLWSLADEVTTTSPFLHGFAPPLPMRGLTDDEATALIRQTQLPASSRPTVDPDTAALIRKRCNNHPYLLQLLGERYSELDDLEQAIESIANDQMVSFFFETDLAMLTDAERGILGVIGRSSSVSSAAIQQTLPDDATSLPTDLQRLAQLGFVERSATGDYTLPNYFFRRWFAELSQHPAQSHGSSTGGEAIVETMRLGENDTPQRRVDDRYLLRTRLGSGASSDVYKAYDSLLDTEVAIKLLRRELAVDKNAIERLRREVVLSRDLSHPNICNVYDLGEDDGQMYITMEYVEGMDLAAVISRQAPLRLGKALDIARKLASAVASLHAHDVVHRDLKPSNVLIKAGGEPVVTDFGLARLQHAPGLTREGYFVGTPAYASPELAAGAALDQRSDLYALGVVLFEMLTGRLPFVADSVQEVLRMQVGTAPPDPSALRVDLPRRLSEIVLHCLAKEPAERVPSASALEQALARCREELGSGSGNGRRSNEPEAAAL